ncbi:MAG: MerR family transcriptional regulator [Pseudomonadota bacterium]
MTTIGRLARRYHLSRSTLLYYDRIGLLQPSGRSPANYRVYTKTDEARLGLICRYRAAGIALATIGEMLEAGDCAVVGALQDRLHVLNEEISHRRGQQHFIVSLLKHKAVLDSPAVMTKARWTALLRAAGMSDTDMMRWHAEFERMAPDAHAHFLQSLGIPADEIALIRSASREVMLSEGAAAAPGVPSGG